MKTIAITSGKGGVGKTNMAVNFGLALANQGKRVLIFDADLGLANVDILFGYSCEHTLADVIENRMQLTDILVDAPDGLKILPASSGVLRLERLSMSQLASLADAMERLSSRFDVLIIDTGAGMTDSVLFFSSVADEVMLVTTPEPTAITDGYALVKVLANEYEVKSLVLLVNEVLDNKEAHTVHKKLSAVCGKHLGVEIRFGAGILKDTHLEKAVRERKPVYINYPTAPVSQSLRNFARTFDSVFTSQKNELAQKGFWNEVLARREQQ
ncbi:MAG: MinD/ParA family protein [Pseudomonadales bacterium]|nr:MinD/ParA family protein [Pseudomonadales bacterium]